MLISTLLNRSPSHSFGIIENPNLVNPVGFSNQLALKYGVRTQQKLLNKIVYEIWRFFKESPEHNHIPIFNERG